MATLTVFGTALAVSACQQTYYEEGPVRYSQGGYYQPRPDYGYQQRQWQQRQYQQQQFAYQRQRQQQQQQQWAYQQQQQQQWAYQRQVARSQRPANPYGQPFGGRYERPGPADPRPYDTLPAGQNRE